MTFMQIALTQKGQAALWVTNGCTSMSKGGGRMVRWCLLNFQCRGVLLIWIIVGQGPSALAGGAGGGCLDIISLFFLPPLGGGPI